MHKVKKPHIYFILIIALILHLVMLNLIKLFGVRPDLIMLSVVFFGLFFGERRGLEAGIFGGFLEDLFSADIFGMNMFVTGITGFLVGTLNTQFFKESKMTQVLLVFFFTLFAMVLHFMMDKFMAVFLGIGASEYILQYAIPSSVYTAILSIPIFSKLTNFYGLKREEFL